MIVLLTHSQDFYTIDGVELHLARRGAEYRRLNTDDFPEHYAMAFEDGRRLWLEAGGQTLDLSAASACWARRIWPGALPEGYPAEAARGSLMQTQAFYDQALGELHNAYWINPLEAGARSENKLLQLRLAREVGFRVPPTLVSSSPEAVRNFAHRHPDGLITKLLVPSAVAMGAHPDFAYTTRLQPEHYQNLELVRWMPQIFQPYLRRRAEYRVVVVGDSLFVGELQVANPDLVDWRAGSDADGLSWRPAQLSDELRSKILSLMGRLGLVSGALDLLASDDDEAYFLEVNQAGEWGWLERDCGLPIAERIAGALIDHQ